MIPVLLSFLGLVLIAACAEFLRRAQWLDRAALISLFVLSVGTRPTLGDHRTCVGNSIRAARAQAVVLGTTARAALATKVASRLQYRDFLMVSLTTFDDAVVSIGWFGRVIVLDDFADSR